MDQQMLCDLRPTVNPLMYRAHLHWPSTVSPKQQLTLWNFLQQWCSRNDVVPYGQVDLGPRHLKAQLIVKRRFGSPKDEVPW